MGMEPVGSELLLFAMMKAKRCQWRGATSYGDRAHAAVMDAAGVHLRGREQ